jgi:hypothetical protein
MGFMELSRRFFSYPSNQRQSATLEYRSSSGSSIGLGLRSADETTLLRGDGTIEFHRRGDFGGRGEYPPGRWISKCDTVQVERIWDKLGNLGPGSFPSRVADPGDAIQYVVACVPNVFASLAIGPEDPSKPVPGEEFMRELYPILGQPESGECLWAVEMSFGSLAKTSLGAEAGLNFRNPGRQSIGLVFGGTPKTSDFTFRYVQEKEGVPYPEWFYVHSQTTDADRTEVVLLAPGSIYERTVSFPCAFPGEGKFRGAVSYRQTGFLDALAGYPILTGMAFSALAEFTL